MSHPSIRRRRPTGPSPFLALLVWLVAALVAALVAVVAATPARAQQPATPQLPPGVTNQTLRDAIQRSGLSESQIRERLQAAGYDSSLVDSYLKSGDPSQRERPAGAAQVEALRRIGVMTIQPYGELTPGAGLETAPDSLRSDSLGASPDDSTDMLDAPRTPSKVFGKDMFRRGSNVVMPVASGIMDPGYRLGTGDVVQVVITGQTEAAYQQEIRPEGTIILPRIGQVPVAGLTVEAARTLLRQRAASLFSGVSSGQTRIDVSVARPRLNAVTVIGEVEHPGTYQVSALATIFHALSRAGGPSDRGSFRRIELRRGGTTVRRLDLYDYLLRGDASGDVRLEHGDEIFVPLAQRNVTVAGAARRPGTYELDANEGFRDLLAFSGGPLATAASDRVRIDRILPPEQRRPGHERTMVDVKIDGNFERLADAPLYDGDVVRFARIGELRRNVVVLRGEVVAPGTFQLAPGMTLGALITAAQGPLPWARTDRVKVSRTVTRTGEPLMLSLDLADSAAARTPLQEFDTVTVLDARRVGVRSLISVTGAVGSTTRREYPYGAGMSLLDAIDLAGGLREEAISVEVSRRRTSEQFSDTTSQVFTIRLRQGGVAERALADFKLEPDDRVFVRASPGYRSQRFVELRGQFNMPGSYAINEGVDRIADVLERAGGLLPAAQPEAFRFLREGRTVAVDLRRARRREQPDNLLLQNGDQLSIDVSPTTVLVTGEVQRSILVVFDRKLAISDYIERAGGTRINADMSRVTVEYPSGVVRRAKSRFGKLRVDLPLQPGAVITVPTKPDRPPRSFRDVLASTVQIVSAIASLALAYAAVTRN